MTPEGEVKKDIREELLRSGFWLPGRPEPANLRGWMYMPVNNGMGASGIPDFLGCASVTITPQMVGMRIGQLFGIEAKALGKVGNTTELQKDRHAEIRAAGGAVLVIDRVEILKEYLHGRKAV